MKKITASLVPAALGYSKWTTPRDAWLLLTGRAERPQTMVQRAGELLEQLVYEWLEDNGIKIVDRQVSGQTQLPCGVQLVGRSDGIVAIDDRYYILSIKTTAYPTMRDEYVVQYYAESLALGVEYPLYLAILDRTRVDVSVHVVEHDTDYAGVVLSSLDAWCAEYILRDVEPPSTTIDEAVMSLPSTSDAVCEIGLISDDDGYELVELSSRIAACKHEIESLTRQRDEIMMRLLQEHPASTYTYNGRKVATVVRPKPRKTYDTELLLRHVPPEVAAQAVVYRDASPYLRWHYED